MNSEWVFLGIVRAFAFIGYGRMMQIISQEWYRHDQHGALTIGPSVGLLGAEERQALAVSLAVDPLFNDHSDATA